MATAPTDSAPRPDLNEAAFNHEASVVLTQLQKSLRDLIRSIPARRGRAAGGARFRRPAELQRAVGVHAKLAWQVHKVAHASDPLTEVVNVPGPSAMSRFLQAAARCGASAEARQAVRQAMDLFEQLVHDHAGSRSALDSMILGLAENGSSQMDLTHRRGAFKANSHIWGVQAAAQLSCFAFQVNPENHRRCDVFTIRGLVDLRRLRSDAPWMISTTRLVDDKGNIQPAKGQELLDPDQRESNPAGLLRKFCSQPLPKFSAIPTGRGYVSVQLEGGSVGHHSAVTCMNGYIWRGAVPRFRDANNRWGRYSAKVRTPAEVLLLDVLVNDEAYAGIEPEAYIYGDHRGSDAESPDRGFDLLAMKPSVVRLGTGAAALATPEVPRYAEMVQHAFDRLGWDGSRFSVYRCRLPYPVMPSSVLMQFQLPE